MNIADNLADEYYGLRWTKQYKTFKNFKQEIDIDFDQINSSFCPFILRRHVVFIQRIL